MCGLLIVITEEAKRSGQPGVQADTEVVTLDLCKLFQAYSIIHQSKS